MFKKIRIAYWRSVAYINRRDAQWCREHGEDMTRIAFYHEWHATQADAKVADLKRQNHEHGYRNAAGTLEFKDLAK